MKTLPFRLRRAPVRLDAPGDTRPVNPVLPSAGGGRMSKVLSALFLRRGRRRASTPR
jgi:hypothetical protein